MFKGLFSRWFVCGALASVCLGGCSQDVDSEAVDVDSDSLAALSQQWLRCANQGEFCAFSGTRQVRYGKTHYTVRTFTGGVQCSAANFGVSSRRGAHCDAALTAADGGGAAGATPAAGSGAAGVAGSVVPPAAGSSAAGTTGTPNPPAAGSGGTGTAGSTPSPAAGTGAAGAAGAPKPPAAGAGSGAAGAAGAPKPPAAGTGAAGAAGAPTPPAAGSGGATSTPSWPGSQGKSGVNGDPVLDRASVEAFGTWRGRPCGVAHTYTDRSSWDSMTRGAGWVFSNFSGFPGLLVVSQGLVPNGRSADLQACANGTYDQNFKDFGSTMVSNGRGASVVRLGWEFNGAYMPWAGTNAAVYKQCFQRAAAAIRQTNPSVIIDWTINAHGTPSNLCGGSSLNCYPGDASVDIIGIDNYDHAPSAASLADFTRVAEAAEGMTWLFNFAKQHGKKFSVGEWGIAPGSDYNQTGENPEFIRWMNQWFAAHAADLAYEVYFNSCMANDVESNLFRPVSSGCVRLNANAGSTYKSLFGK
jgi:hypothetical protein